MTVKIKTDFDIEFYPDGTVMVFTDDKGTEITKQQVIESMMQNARACDWLGPQNMTEWGVELIKAAK